MFYKSKINGYIQPQEGIKFKTLVYGERTLLAEFQLKKGSKLPRHRHPHEQSGYLVGGRMRLSIGEETFEVEPGDSWCISSNIEHGGETIEDSIAIEVFSPVREDYLPQNLG
jgi:quercetin dioxygenase-like cupin family protein